VSNRGLVDGFQTEDGAQVRHAPIVEPRIIEVTDAEFRQSLALTASDIVPAEDPLESALRLFEISPLSGTYLYEVRAQRLYPERAGGPMDEPSADQLTQAYLRWCEQGSRGGGGTWRRRQWTRPTNHISRTLAVALPAVSATRTDLAFARLTQYFSRQAIKVLLVGGDDDVFNAAGNDRALESLRPGHDSSRRRRSQDDG
jgi:hypothetical protein